MPEQRKVLAVLQQQQPRLSFTGGKLHVSTPSLSKKRKNDENDTPLKSQRKDGIYEDPATPLRKKTKLSCDAGVQTEPTADNSVQNKAAQDVIDMLTSEKPTEKYWEMVAVERKTALISALDENKDLHKHNSRLQEKVHKLEEKVDHLEEDNKKLEVLLSEAKALAELVESVVGNESTEENGEEDPKLLEEEEDAAENASIEN